MSKLANHCRRLEMSILVTTRLMSGPHFVVRFAGGKLPENGNLQDAWTNGSWPAGTFSELWKRCTTRQVEPQHHYS
jgi:hypothetical protein